MIRLMVVIALASYLLWKFYGSVKWGPPGAFRSMVEPPRLQEPSAEVEPFLPLANARIVRFVFDERSIETLEQLWLNGWTFKQVVMRNSETGKCRTLTIPDRREPIP